MIFLVSAAFICGVHAQDFSTSSSDMRAPLYNPQMRSPSKGGVPLSKPVPIGMAETIDKYGLDAFNPWAPKSYGYGALASNVADAEGNTDPEEKNKTFGGIVIFGYMF